MPRLVLVDTSVWINHFRFGSPKLRELLLDGEVMCHPFIVGELACGQMKNRTEILGLLQSLPQASILGAEEILSFIEERGLFGIGIGLVDAHLLASSLLARAKFWTEDKRLGAAAEKLKTAL